MKEIKFQLMMWPCLMCRRVHIQLSKEQFSRVASEMADEVGGLCVPCLADFHRDPMAAYVLHDGLMLKLEVKK